MRCIHLSLATCLAIASVANAQNLIPFGNFQEGALYWKLTQFNDTNGTTGFGVNDVTTEATSEAVFANFQTLTSVITATYVSNAFVLPAAMVPVTFNVMWDKGTVTTPIPSASVNRVEFRIYDSSNTRVFSQQITVPTQTGTKERASFSNMFTPAASGMFTAEFYLRHSNLAGLPYTTWVDDLVIGTPTDFVYHKGCNGTGGLAPLITSTGSPAVASQNFAVTLSSVPALAKALLAVGLSNQKYGPLNLPYNLGGGCLLSQDLLILLFYNTGRTGGLTQQLPIPNNSKLKGLKLYLQFAVDDKGSVNPSGFTTTAGMRVTVL